MLDLGEDTILREIKAGRLKAFYVRSSLRIRTSELERYVTEMEGELCAPEDSASLS